MQVAQIAEIVNGALKQTTGLNDVVMEEDLSNVVTIGRQIDGNEDVCQLLSKNLVNKIGIYQPVAYKYQGSAPNLWKTGAEYGSIRQKITFELVNADTNESWMLQDGVSVDPNVFTEPKVNVQYFNGTTVFEIPISITTVMLVQSFASAGELNALVSGIFLYIENTRTIMKDNMVMRNIDYMIATTLQDETTNGANLRVVHLLTDFKKKHKGFDDITTMSQAQECPEFIRYMTTQLRLYKSRMSRMNTLFNIKGKQRFTSDDRLHFVMLDTLEVYAETYLYSDTFHDEYTHLPKAESVSYWQGIGDDWSDDNISSINVKLKSGDVVNKKGIACVMFDDLAVILCTERARTTTNYNGKGEFTNYWFKEDCQYANDDQENFVVFLID